MKKVLNTAILALASVSAMPRDVDKTAYENLPTVSTDDFKQLWTDATIDHYNY
jgi:trehalose/maltose hydrolase-like predicted phosphorylase